MLVWAGRFTLTHILTFKPGQVFSKVNALGLVSQRVAVFGLFTKILKKLFGYPVEIVVNLRL